MQNYTWPNSSSGLFDDGILPDKNNLAGKWIKLKKPFGQITQRWVEDMDMFGEVSNCTQYFDSHDINSHDPTLDCFSKRNKIYKSGSLGSFLRPIYEQYEAAYQNKACGPRYSKYYNIHVLYYVYNI
jgi:hypothetical protein